MTLIRIHRVLLRHFGVWRDGPYEFDFDYDIVVPHGPNGSGKSSLWLGIVFGLLQKTGGVVVPAITPIGGAAGNPYTEIEFTACGSRWRIEKTYMPGGGQTRLYELTADGAAEIAHSDEAVIRCRELVADTEARDIIAGKPRNLDDALRRSLSGHIIELLMPLQGSMSREFAVNEGIRQIGLEPDALEGRTLLGRLLARASESRGEYSTETGRDRKGSPLLAARAQLEALQVEERVVLESIERIAELIRQRMALEAEVEDAGADEDLRAKARQLREEADVHQRRREVVEQELQAAEANLQQAMEATELREELRATASAVAVLVTEADAAQQAAEQVFRQAEKQVEGDRERTTELGETIARLDAWEQHRLALARRGPLEQELDQLNRDRDARDALNDTLIQFRADQGAITLASVEQWAELTQIREERAVIRAAAESWAVVEAVPGPDHQIRIDGTTVEADAPATAGETVEVLDEKGATRLSLRNTAVLVNLDDLDAREGQILGELHARGRAELNERQAEHNKLQGRIGETDAQLVLLDNQMGPETRVERIATLRNETAAEIVEPVLPRPDEDEDDWRVHLRLRRTDLEQAREALNEAAESRGAREAELNQARENHELSRTDLEDANDLLGADRDTVGADETVNEVLSAAGLEVETRAQVAEPLTTMRTEAEDVRRQRANQLDAQADAQVENVDHIREFGAQIELLREQGNVARHNDISIRINELEQRIEEHELEKAARDLLHVAVQHTLQAARGEVHLGVRANLRNWMRYILDNDRVDVVLNDDGFPEAVQYVPGWDIPFERESHGTKELLNLLYRLALADIIADETGYGLTLILDDPFGNFDQHRRARMLELLQARVMERGHQLILFTCRPEDFPAFGVHIDLRGDF